MRSQDSEESYFPLFRKTSPSVWTTFTTSEWTTGKTSHSATTAILSAVGSAGNTCFIPPSALAQNKKLWSPQICCSASPAYAAHKKKPTITPGAALTAVIIWHTHWQKFCVLSTSPTCKSKIRLIMSILSQVHRHVMQPAVWVLCMNFQLNRSIDSSNKWKCFIFNIAKFDRRIIPKHRSHSLSLKWTIKLV